MDQPVIRDDQYVFILRLISFTDFYYCTRSFQASTLLWTFECTKQPSNGGKVFLRFRYIWTLFLCAIMILMYLAIFCRTRQRLVSVNNQMRRALTTDPRVRPNVPAIAKYKRSMLIQAALTCGVFILGIVLANFLPKLVTKFLGQKGRIALPVSLFLTNRRARKYLYLLLVCKNYPVSSNVN
uniref:G_PROTEIN_RECEP_F1_2 domain-containing protein n=1 Tax=Elaeophora elaphi TaxID=1147741 RepID=A0A0R3RNT8_9BILA